MQLILDDGWPIALARADEVLLYPALLDLADLEEGHGLMRFACVLALHAFEVRTGLVGAVRSGRAERFASDLRMPAEQFLAVADATDVAGRALRRADRAGPCPAARAPCAGERRQSYP